jgi:hypothetical protein
MAREGVGIAPELDVFAVYCTFVQESGEIASPTKISGG